MPNVLWLVCRQTSWQDLRRLPTFHSSTFVWKHVQERERRDGSTTGPMAAETAAIFMNSGISGSHERRSIKFCVHSGGDVSCKGAARMSLSSSVHLPPSSSVSVVVPGGWSSSGYPPWRACS